MRRQDHGSRQRISIHASAKEATVIVHRWEEFTDFNPRLREGGDKESDPISLAIENFNPRLREGGDAGGSPGKARSHEISIHASAKEATTINTSDNTQAVFQSTPPRRRRPQHIVIPQLSCTYLVSTTFLSTIFSFISQYVVLFFLF